MIPCMWNWDGGGAVGIQAVDEPVVGKLLVDT